MTPEQRARKFLDDMFAEIEHGDADHRRWLRTELDKWLPRLTDDFHAAQEDFISYL